MKCLVRWLDKTSHSGLHFKPINRFIGFFFGQAKALLGAKLLTDLSVLGWASLALITLGSWLCWVNGLYLIDNYLIRQFKILRLHNFLVIVVNKHTCKGKNLG